MPSTGKGINKDVLMALYKELAVFSTKLNAHTEIINKEISKLQESGLEGMAGGRGDEIALAIETIAKTYTDIVEKAEACQVFIDNKLNSMGILEEANRSAAATDAAATTKAKAQGDLSALAR